MKFPESWLREHVDTPLAGDALDHRLTMIGLEVEGSETLGGTLDGVVVAQIVACEKHPEADRLQVCQVDAGGPAVLQIVCGAPNARPGLKAPLATIGTTVGTLTIKPAKLRGVESNGMLCSAKELGIDADASGLLELPADAPVGTPLAQYLGLPDRVIELGLTPNRADCFSVRGIAQDVAAATGTDVKPFAIDPVAPASQAALEVRLDAGADAPRYAGRVIEGIDATVSTPQWMAERLRRSGVRPVSFLVDVTQYVMLELGQPMHAFDRATLKGPVGVRKARAGESLKLLDGRDATLDDGFLVITDADHPVALAGVMGGHDTRVTDATRDVFLEAAHFAPAAIIGRARKLGMHTDASHRFERGVDPELPRIAIERATRLILDTAGGVPGPVAEATLGEHLPKPASIPLRRTRLARVLGLAIADADVERILRSLGMQVTATADGWTAVPPSRRFDLAIEDDLIEEVARIHGYDAIPATLPAGGATVHAPAEGRLGEGALRARLVARDWLEAITFAFIDADTLAAWSVDGPAVPIANPLSAELAVMRTMLLPGLAAALAHNVARQQTRVRLFELGNVFASRPGDAPAQVQRIAAVATGPARGEQWGERARPLDVFYLKGDLDALAGEPLDYRPSRSPWAHPGRSADVWRDGVRIGWLGELHPSLQRRLDVDAPVVAFEVDLEPLAARAIPRATGVARFPPIRRDLAFIVPDAVTWSDFATTVRNSAGPVLRDLRLFDLYTGKGVETGRKSFAMGLILQDETRTLTDEDANAVVASVVARVAEVHGATVRG